LELLRIICLILIEKLSINTALFLLPTSGKNRRNFDNLNSKEKLPGALKPYIMGDLTRLTINSSDCSFDILSSANNFEIP
jgi:hypothetical protein